MFEVAVEILRVLAKDVKLDAKQMSKVEAFSIEVLLMKYPYIEEVVTELEEFYFTKNQKDQGINSILELQK